MTFKPGVNLFLLLICSVISFAQAPAELQAKLSTEIKHLEAYSTDPEVVSAVKNYNSSARSPEE